eukprot:47367-Eustigmatos_ZCMA.PRE.1
MHSQISLSRTFTPPPSHKPARIQTTHPHAHADGASRTHLPQHIIQTELPEAVLHNRCGAMPGRAAYLADAEVASSWLTPY